MSDNDRLTDYLRGRRMKTQIVVRPDGAVTLSTVGRGKSPLRWLDRMQGKKPMSVVRVNESTEK